MKILHLCSDYYNMYENLMEYEQKSGVELKVFQFISTNSPILYNKKYLTTIQCFNEVDRLLFHLKEKKVEKIFYKLSYLSKTAK